MTAPVLVPDYEAQSVQDWTRIVQSILLLAQGTQTSEDGQRPYGDNESGMDRPPKPLWVLPDYRRRQRVRRTDEV